MPLLHLHGVICCSRWVGEVESTDKGFSLLLNELKLREEVACKIEFQVMLAGLLHIGTDVLDWILFRTLFYVL